MRLGDTKIFVVDCETTGLDATLDSICEVALIRWLPPRYSGTAERLEWSTLVKPRTSIPSEAFAIHGISNSDVEGAPSISEALATLRRFMPPDSLVFSHNLKFDGAFLNLDGRLQACTYRLAQRVWPECTSFGNVDLARWLGIALDSAKAHRALTDAKITAKVLYRLFAAFAQRNGELPSVESIVEWSTPDALFDCFPFGKHRGQRISTAPSDYLRWALNKWHDAEPGLLAAVRNELRLRA